VSFNVTPTTVIYTLSLHDALPILPADARLITEWCSVSLPEVLRDINKYSNNVMARQLLLTIAADTLKLPATPERGASAVQSWLRSEEHTSELQSRGHLVCRLLLEK